MQKPFKKMNADEAQDAASEMIAKAVAQKGPYTHNLVSITLQSLAQAHGVAAANAVVEELHLERLGFSKVEADEK